MNPNGGENQPRIEVAVPQTGETEAQAVVEKSLVGSPENSPQKQNQQFASQVANDLALPGAAITTDDASTSTPVATSATDAADTDRIEKQWIEKAKSVIAQTRDDPFEQKNAMSKVKAEYIQKRFNKTIKTDDTAKK
jgi:hypothetical protein